MGAGGFDLDLEGLVPQMPLHEGRRYRVFRSGGVQSLACAEDQMVSGFLCRHRKGPRYLCTVSTNEKEQVLLEILHDAFRAWSG